jgi:hypothetical protein
MEITPEDFARLVKCLKINSEETQRVKELLFRHELKAKLEEHDNHLFGSPSLKEIGEKITRLERLTYLIIEGGGIQWPRPDRDDLLEWHSEQEDNEQTRIRAYNIAEEKRRRNYPKPERSCSFCGKKESEVIKLIAGPNTQICDDCVDIAKDIIEEHKNG